MRSRSSTALGHEWWGPSSPMCTTPKTATGTGTPTSTRSRPTSRRAAMAGGKSYILGLTLLSLALPVRAQTPQAPRGSNPTDLTPGVRPGDMIRVWVWREKDYSGDFPVDGRGTVTLPVLGEISVSGHTAEQLTDTLREAYRKDLKSTRLNSSHEWI